MAKIDIFKYKDPRLFLLDSYEKRKVTDPDFSVRKWAKEMGLAGHTLLAMILQGKRNLKIKHTDFFSQWLKLNSKQLRYFKLLIQFANAKTIEEKSHLLSLLSEVNPQGTIDRVDIEQFDVLSNWIHMAIMGMTKLKNFNGTVDEIFYLVKGKKSKFEIRLALERLLRLKLIAYNEDRKIYVTHNYVSTPDDVASKGARAYHRQVMDLAKDALEEIPLERREFQSFVMAIDKDKVDLAKQMIRDFRKELHLAVSGRGDHIYQTNIQFFQLTEDSGLDQEITVLSDS